MLKRSGFKRKTKRPAPLVPKTLGKSAVSKLPWRSKAYRQWVAQFPCLVCRQPSAPPHHIREMFPNRSMTRQIGDMWVIPLCHTHHNELHSAQRTFWTTHYLLNPVVWCIEAYAAWQKETEA